MLDHLPQELLSLIAPYLDRSDLYRLIVTSRQLCTAFQHILYRNVSLCIEINNRHIVSAFFYAITRSPQLASCVRSLKLRCWMVPTTYLNEHSKRAAVDAALVRRLVDEKKGYSAKERSKWLGDLEKDDIDAWMTLLIPQLKGLRKLAFSWPYGGHHFYDMLENMHREDQPVLPHLREVYMSASGVINGVQSNYLNAFFKLPCVRKIGCFSVSDTTPRAFDETESDPMEEAYLHGRSLQPRSCNITDIDLESSDAIWGMRDWIRACRHLRTFKITLNTSVIFTMGRNSLELGFRRLYRSFLLHRSTLECIWIDTTPDLVNTGFIGSFLDFSVLRFLHAPFSMLIEVDEQGLPMKRLQDILPSSLETLRVFVGLQNALGGIELLSELAASKTDSELTAIYFECPDASRATFNSSMEIEAGLDRLMRISHENGISFFDDRILTRSTDNLNVSPKGEEDMSPGVKWSFNEALDPMFF